MSPKNALGKPKTSQTKTLYETKKKNHESFSASFVKEKYINDIHQRYHATDALTYDNEILL